MVEVEGALRELVKRFSPSSSRGWDRVIQIDVTGRGGGKWHIVVKNQ